MVPVLVSVPFSGMCLLGGCLFEEAAFGSHWWLFSLFLPFLIRLHCGDLLLLWYDRYDHIDERGSSFISFFASSAREWGVADGVVEAKLAEMYTLQTTVA